MRRIALVLGLFIVILMFLVAASVVFGVEPGRSLLHIEKTDTRATISCVDHKPPTVRSFKNEPLVVVDCERTK